MHTQLAHASVYRLTSSLTHPDTACILSHLSNTKTPLVHRPPVDTSRLGGDRPVNSSSAINSLLSMFATCDISPLALSRYLNLHVCLYCYTHASIMEAPSRLIRSLDAPDPSVPSHAARPVVGGFRTNSEIPAAISAHGTRARPTRPHHNIWL